MPSTFAAAGIGRYGLATLVQVGEISVLYTPNYNCLVILNEDQNVRRNSGEWYSFKEAKGQEWLFVLLNQRGDNNGILQSKSCNFIRTVGQTSYSAIFHF